MKRIPVSLAAGFLLTGAIFVLHLVFSRYFSWRDKPMMPNLFTYLLFPGYRAAVSFPVNHSLQLVIAIVLDGLFFSFPIWLLLTLKGHLFQRR